MFSVWPAFPRRAYESASRSILSTSLKSISANKLYNIKNHSYTTEQIHTFDTLTLVQS